jgi:xylulokinase
MPKIRWLREHRRELFAGAKQFVSISDYVLLRLGLEACIAYPLASRYMAFDVRKLCWSEEMLEAAGLSAERLPRPAPAGTTAGKLSRTAAGALGLGAGTPLVVGGHDQPCGALGMGAIRPGMVVDSMGTYECLTAVGAEPSLDEAALAASLNSYCHVVPGRYITIAYFPSGLMVQWFCDTFCGEDARAAEAEGKDLHGYLEEMAPGGPSGLCVMPHLIGSGNPHFDPRATGAVVGLVQTTSRHQMYKGILEGLACELALISELIEGAVGRFDTIRCTGGGARSRLGLRLRAAMTGKRMEIMRSAEAVCLGAAALAGVSAGTYAGLEEAVADVVEVAETVEPEAELAEAYGRQMKQYRALYPALGPVREL